jgi:hypothetical protein
VSNVIQFLVSIVLFVVPASAGNAQSQVAWLDESKPASWNKPGLSIPTAPRVQATIDPRCRQMARPAELQEDRRVREQGWDLVGAYQGGWQIVVIRGTANYDGMCRPRQYQVFVFVRGVFAGTLSPETMDSRADGALGQVFLQRNDRLMAEYARYTDRDPLCCPSRITSVTFEVALDRPVVRPISASSK